MAKSIAEQAGLSFERRYDLAESCLRTLIEVAGDFADLEVPATHAAFVSLACDSYGIDATDRALAAIRRKQIFH